MIKFFIHDLPDIGDVITYAISYYDNLIVTGRGRNRTEYDFIVRLKMCRACEHGQIAIYSVGKSRCFLMSAFQKQAGDTASF